MEPRPPKATRAPNAPYISSPGPVPNSERNPEKPAWLDQPPLPTAPAWQDAQPAGAPPGGFPPNGPWYDQTGQAPSMDPMRGPLMPVVSPRGERRARWLGPILALLLVALVVAAGAFAVRAIRGDDDDNPPPTTAANLTVPTATAGAGGAALPGSPEPTEETGTEATATPEPTEEPATEEAAPTEQASADTETGEEPTARSTNFKDATEFLPALSEVPDGYVVTDSGSLSKTDIAEQLGGDGAATLNEWEWRENAYRYFDIPAEEAPADDATISLTVSVHRFRLPAGAEAGLDGLADIVAGTAGYEEVSDVDQIGDQTRALTGETEEGKLFVLYVRTSNIVIRIGGFSVSGDSSADVIALAEEIVAKMNG